MTNQRCSGILAHVSSLPGPHGIGDLGKAALEFVDFLHRSGQRIWQMLPIGPTLEGDSPYTSRCSFAGNPFFICIDKLVEEGLLSESWAGAVERLPIAEIDYDAVRQVKLSAIAESSRHFRSQGTDSQRREYAVFSARNKSWLEDYARFVVLQDQFGTEWWQWPADLRSCRTEEVSAPASELHEDIEIAKYTQFAFYRQWFALKSYANERGVQLFGDVPFFPAAESADVWQHQELFHLDKEGQRTIVAGVPPDYFSKTGQLWGFPIYRWDRMAKEGYRWWIQRLKHAFEMFDLIRLDHFRGFEACWAVPATHSTAAHGEWMPGPGADLFCKAEEELGSLPIVAEDLGHITPAVHELRDRFEFPGVRVLEFGFNDNLADTFHRPHSFPKNCAAYTGTHDNDTVVGWFSENDSKEALRWKCNLLAYANSQGDEIHWDMIRLAYASVAKIAMVPVQDVLGLGSEARMNTPGEANGNWRWRFSQQQLTAKVERRLLDLVKLYERGKES